MENWMKMVEMYEGVAVLPQVKEWRMEEWKKKQKEEQKKKCQGEEQGRGVWLFDGGEQVEEEDES